MGQGERWLSLAIFFSFYRIDFRGRCDSYESHLPLIWTIYFPTAPLQIYVPVVYYRLAFWSKRGGLGMQPYGVNQLRKMFLEFFESKGHLALKSFSLVPHNDKSLLLINSGMAPLKPYFTGQEIPPRKRVTTCQKCIRTGDIENVGKTARHGTFFEMLGNF